MTESDSHPITALVEYQVRTENNSVDEWLEVWNTRADDAQIGEPETEAYAAAVNVQDESNVLVFERYQNGRSSIDAHIDRAAHAELMETMGSRNMSKRRVMSTQFTDLNDYGWWSRPGSTSPMHEGIVLIVLGFRFGSAADLATYVALSQKHAEYCWDVEPETLIYSAGLATADADREIDLHKGDVVFIMASTDMEAVERHANDDRHVALTARFDELGIQMERSFMRTYKTSGHGFLWRE